MLIYVHNGLTYLPACSNVTNITVLAQPILDVRGGCPDNYDVKYIVNNVEKFGYIRNQRIITQFSSRSMCEESKNREMVIYNYRLTRSKFSPFNITATNYSPIITRINPMDLKLFRLSYHHDTIIDDLNFDLDMDKEISSEKMNGHTEYMPKFDFDGPQTPKSESSMLDYFDNTISNIAGQWKSLLRIVVIAGIIILICITFLPAGVGIFFKFLANIVTTMLNGVLRFFTSVISDINIGFSKKAQKRESAEVETGHFISRRNERIIDLI